MLVKWLEHGQRRPYGDTYYVAEIHTSRILTDDEIKSELKEDNRLPYKVWKEKMSNISDYFRGWYKLKKTDYGYKYEGCYPYDD